MLVKRLFDVFFSLFGIIICIPIWVIVPLLIIIDSPGNPFFSQRRVGRNNKDFTLYKFRSMKLNSEISGLLTVGSGDSRITTTGFYLRRFKMDELPQLFNILKGDMSFVGPRPEVRKYVDMYDFNQMKVLAIRPGLTDYASVQYIRENELLKNSPDPETTYIREIMPAKIQLNLKYMDEMSLLTDLRILARTVPEIFR